MINKKILLRGHQCICNGCGKKYFYADENSPVLENESWRCVCDYYGISRDDERIRNYAYRILYMRWKQADGKKKNLIRNMMFNPEYHVQFCTECMEKALGKPLTSEVRDLPHNQKYFETKEGKS